MRPVGSKTDRVAIGRIRLIRANTYTRLPLYVITGFLGSGKTSLLRHWLESEEFIDTAVLVNEFGEIGLDHELIEKSEEDTVVLKGGCICCTIREDLATTVRRLADLRRTGKIKAFSRLVIETSGLADPVPILVTLKSDPRITQHFEFKGTIVTVDGIAGAHTIRSQVESVRQVIFANRAVITKCDLAGDTEIAKLRAKILHLNNSLDVICSDHNGVVATSLFDDLNNELDLNPPNVDKNGKGAPNPDQIQSNSTEHSERFSSFSWEFKYELDWTAFGVWLTALLHTHGDRILRVKGILNVSGSRTPVAVHGVQHIVSPPTHMTRSSNKSQTSRLVFVVEDLSPDLIRSSFAAFHNLGRRVTEQDHIQELPAGTGRTVAGWPRRRARAASWLKC